MVATAAEASSPSQVRRRDAGIVQQAARAGAATRRRPTHRWRRWWRLLWRGTGRCRGARRRGLGQQRQRGEERQQREPRGGEAVTRAKSAGSADGPAISPPTAGAEDEAERQSLRRPAPSPRRDPRRRGHVGRDREGHAEAFVEAQPPNRRTTIKRQRRGERGRGAEGRGQRQVPQQDRASPEAIWTAHRSRAPASSWPIENAASARPIWSRSRRSRGRTAAGSGTRCRSRAMPAKFTR